jgi:hypothetical protein
MRSVEDLFEPIATEALINEVYNYSLWQRLYILPDKSLLSVKHVMKNYIKVEEASITRQGHLRFHTQEDSPPRH